MSKKQKEHQSIVPGNGFAINVVNNDIVHALKTWKQKLKQNTTLTRLTELREFEKPSVTKRREKLRAKFLNTRQQDY